MGSIRHYMNCVLGSWMVKVSLMSGPIHSDICVLTYNSSGYCPEKFRVTVHVWKGLYKAACVERLQLCLAISVSELSYVSAKRVAYLIWTDSHGWKTSILPSIHAWKEICSQSYSELQNSFDIIISMQRCTHRCTSPKYEFGGFSFKTATA